MKSYLILIVSVVMLLSLLNACSGNADKQGKTEKTPGMEQAGKNLQTIDLTVEGMTCGGCEIAVIAAVERLDGVFEVRASHTEANAIIVFDSTVAHVDQIRVAIEKAGYKALDFEIVK